MAQKWCYSLGHRWAGVKMGPLEIGRTKTAECRRENRPYWHDLYSANCALELYKSGVLYMAPNYNLLKIEKRWWQQEMFGRMIAKVKITDHLVKRLFGCKSIEEFLLRLDRQQIALPRYADFGGEWATPVTIQVLTAVGSPPILFIESHGQGHALIWRGPIMEKRAFVIKGYECDNAWGMWVAPSETFIRLILGDDDLQLVEVTHVRDKADPDWRDSIDKPHVI